MTWGDMEVPARQAEIALLGVPMPDMCDVGEGGFRATCMMCDEDTDPFVQHYAWHTTDYEAGVLEAYIQHVHEAHRREVMS